MRVDSLFVIRPAAVAPLFPYTTLFRSSVFTARALGIAVALAVVTALVMLAALRTQTISFGGERDGEDRKSTRLNSSHITISYAVFCLKKKKRNCRRQHPPQARAQGDDD